MEAGGSQNLEVGLDRDFKLLQSKGGFMSATVYELKQEHQKNLNGEKLNEKHNNRIIDNMHIIWMSTTMRMSSAR